MTRGGIVFINRAIVADFVGYIFRADTAPWFSQSEREARVKWLTWAICSTLATSDIADLTTAMGWEDCGHEECRSVEPSWRQSDGRKIIGPRERLAHYATVLTHEALESAGISHLMKTVEPPIDLWERAGFLTWVARYLLTHDVPMRQLVPPSETAAPA